MMTHLLICFLLLFLLSLIFLIFRGYRIHHFSPLSLLLNFIIFDFVVFVYSYYFLSISPIEILIVILSQFLIALVLFPIIRNWNVAGQSFYVNLVILSLFVTIYLIWTISLSSLLMIKIFGGIILLFDLLALFLMFLEIFSILNVICRVKNKRIFDPHNPPKTDGYFPLVSLHVPMCTEPPAMVKATLYCLSRLDYPNFEVLVIDNNTKSKKLWQPVEEYCRKLGSRFKFFHLDYLPGFKSGALNFALKKTDPKAEIIGIIDSDYEVEKDFLKKSIPYFKDPKVAIVQAPQDYRHFKETKYSEQCYWVYRYFFTTVMNSTNSDNAASFVGTMGLIRKELLEEIKGWDEECITEDIEIGLRIHNKGLSSVYLDYSFGKGLIPDEFKTYKQQRFRWSFGNAQVIKKHFWKLFSCKGKLKLIQKIGYLSALSIWFNTLLAGSIALFVCTGFNFVFDKNILSPLIWATGLIFLIFIFRRSLGFLWCLKIKTKQTIGKMLCALNSFFSLTGTMAVAWILGFLKRRETFWRTSKFRHEPIFRRALYHVRWEIILGFLSLILAVIVLLYLKDRLILFLLLLIQAYIYLSSLFVSIESVKSRKQFI